MFHCKCLFHIVNQGRDGESGPPGPPGDVGPQGEIVSCKDTLVKLIESHYKFQGPPGVPGDTGLPGEPGMTGLPGKMVSGSLAMRTSD